MRARTWKNRDRGKQPLQAQYSEWTVGSLSSATCPFVIMQFTGCHQPALRLLLARKCNCLAEKILIICVMWHARTHKFHRGWPTVHSYTVVTSVHTYPVSLHFPKFPLWRPFSKVCGYSVRFRLVDLDIWSNCNKIFSDKNKSVYVWTGPGYATQTNQIII